MALIWVGYNGPVDPRSEDHAVRKFKLGDIVTMEKLLEIMNCSGRSPTVAAAHVSNIELEVHTALVSENTNGATCANAWVGTPEAFAPRGEG